MRSFTLSISLLALLALSLVASVAVAGDGKKCGDKRSGETAALTITSGAGPV